MPNVRASSATIGTTCLPTAGSRSSCASSCTKIIVVDCSRSRVPSSIRANASGGTASAGACAERAGRKPPSACAARVQVLHLGRVVGRLVQPERDDVVVGERQREAVAELLQRVVVELLLLVGAHLALAPVAHAVALLGLGEDHRRLALVRGGRAVRGVDLHRVVAAAAQAVDVLVGHVGDDRLQLRVLVEEVLAVEAAVGGGVGLELAVDRLVQPLEDHAVVVAREERVPVGAPHQLHHVPARAGEQTLELLHHRAVAAHRAVEPLQVAVDDEDQVVEALARGERERGERLRLVHLAVADERPHLAAGGGEDAAVLEVAHEPRLVDRVDRPEAHRAGGELPEVGHQPRVAVGREALAAHLAAVVLEALLAQAAPRGRRARRRRARNAAGSTRGPRRGRRGRNG